MHFVASMHRHIRVPLPCGSVSSELWCECWYALRVDIRFRVGTCQLIFVTVAFRLDLQHTWRESGR